MFDDLLTYLTQEQPAAAQTWRGWRIAPVGGGANNLLYRAARADADLAVKLTIRDARDRAGREYAALTALRQAGLDLAPEPLWLERERYRQPVVVQGWLDGAVLTAPPRTQADWEALLRHYCAIHTLTPARGAALPEATINADSPAACRALVRLQAELLPPAARPPELEALLARFAVWPLPDWSVPPRALCRVDSNWRNFLRRPAAWASVDWENSGWGDPAFEIADLITHPAYRDTPRRRWDWLAEAYARRAADRGGRLRIQTYVAVMRVWWAVRCARSLYEVPRGLDPRLAARPPDWEQQTRWQYRRAVELALAALDTPLTR